MKRILTPLALLALSLGALTAHAQDTLDVIHYHLRLDVGHLQSRTLQGSATLTLQLLRPTDEVRLDLTAATVDSVRVEGQRADSFAYDRRHLRLPVEGQAVGQPFEVEVFYSSTGYVEAAGWGGMHFDNSIYYNLGVAFGETPHGMGRAWFPCHDSFRDKATYTMQFTSPAGWTITSSGLRDSAVENADGSETSHWTLPYDTPTYLISLSCGPFRYIHKQTASLCGTYPTIIAYTTQDSSRVAEAFAQLDQVVPMFERCFGPYRWGTIGYTGTPLGSMEHANNISLYSGAMTSMTQSMQGTMAHELSHAWFGNLVTCDSSADMWINEGGASFCEEVAAEGVKGPAYGTQVYLDNLSEVLLTTHITDDGYHPLYGQPASRTYGSTVYDKGATVWHSLRGYMGDSVFYACMRQLFDRCAFGNLTSLQLRDSLARYSGMDLTGFFDFHVFRPGFVDYLIDDLQTEEQSGRWLTTVTVRQKMVGGDSCGPVRANRLPVTFFHRAHPIATEMLCFDDESYTTQLLLDEEPTFALPDYYRALSDAVIDADTLVTERRNFDLPGTFSKVTLSSTPDDTIFLHMALHFADPDGEYHGDSILNPGIVRMANHYWVLSGTVPANLYSKLTFQYLRTSTTPMDNRLLPTTHSSDSLRVLYRRDSQQPWRQLSTLTSGSFLSGECTVSNLRRGQYTLAIIDDSLYAEPASVEPEPQVDVSFSVYPNPSHGEVTLRLPSATSQPLTLRVTDPLGHLLLGPLPVLDGQRLTLPRGTCLLQLLAPDGHPLGTRKVEVR